MHHPLRVAGTCIDNGGLQNASSGFTVGTDGLQEKAGTDRENWMDIIRRDLKDMDTTWDEAEELATDRTEWSRGVDPYGTGGHVPPIFELGGTLSRMSPSIFLE